MMFGATKQQDCTPDAVTNWVHGHVTIEGKAADIHSSRYSKAWPSAENQTPFFNEKCFWLAKAH